MPNPFRFAAPVDGEQFAGRKREVRDTIGLVRDHVNVAVISPRRFGKTSLVNLVCARVERSRATVARLNAMSANDDAVTFASRLVSAVYRARGPWQRARDSLSTFVGSFRQFQPAVTVGPGGAPTFTFTAESAGHDPSEIISHAYRLMATAPTPVVFIDEFQELERVPGNLPGLFKGLAGPVPNDIQHLAYDVFAAVESSREVTEDDVTAGMGAAVEQEAGAFIDTFAALTGNQRMVLAALAVAPEAKPQSAAFLSLTGYANPSGVKRALTALEGSGTIARRAGSWTVVNPFLRSWLADQAAPR